MIYWQREDKRQKAAAIKGGRKMTLTNEDLQAIATLLQPINDRLDKVDSRLDGVENRLDRVENRLDKVENRLDKVESEISALKVGQKELSKELRKVKDKVNATYEIALDAWGQSTENRVWLEEKAEMPS